MHEHVAPPAPNHEDARAGVRGPRRDVHGITDDGHSDDVAAVVAHD